MKYLAAFVIGVGLFAQSAHAIDRYWILIKTSNLFTSSQQWGAKLHDTQKACTQTLVKKAFDLEFLIEDRRTGPWAYMDMFIGNTDVPYEYLECVWIEIDVEGNKKGFYD